MLATLMFPIVCMRMRVKPSAARRLFDVTAWAEPAYVVYAFAMFFGFLGLYIPFFYVQLYSIEERIVGTSLAFYLLPILNAASFFGRLVSPSSSILEEASAAARLTSLDTKLCRGQSGPSQCYDFVLLGGRYPCLHLDKDTVNSGSSCILHSVWLLFRVLCVAFPDCFGDSPLSGYGSAWGSDRNACNTDVYRPSNWKPYRRRSPAEWVAWSPSILWSNCRPGDLVYVFYKNHQSWRTCSG